MVKRALNDESKEALRMKIMDAAREMFVAEGFERVSMRRIAEKTGYSSTTIYLYFEDKADLLNQICERTFAQLAKSIERIFSSDEKPAAVLRRGLTEYINFGLAHPSEYELVFIIALPSGKEEPFENTSGRTAFETLRRAVRQCADSGLLPESDTELSSQVLWAGIHGVTSLLIKHKGFPFVDRETLIGETVETLVRGVLKESRG